MVKTVCIKQTNISPMKILIEKYESIELENESIIQCETKDDRIGVSESCAKPKTLTKNDVSSANPKGFVMKQNSVGARNKKRVWGVKKNGLYGWKMVVVDTETSNNIHSKNNGTQPTSDRKPTLKSCQQTNFRKWLVTPSLGEGGQPSGMSELSETKFINQESFENIHLGVTNPGPEDQFPAKSDVD